MKHLKKQKRLSAEELAYIRSDVDKTVDQSENPEDAKKSFLVQTFTI